MCRVFVPWCFFLWHPIRRIPSNTYPHSEQYNAAAHSEDGVHLIHLPDMFKKILPRVKELFGLELEAEQIFYLGRGDGDGTCWREGCYDWGRDEVHQKSLRKSRQ